MLRKNLLSLCASAVVMLLLPWASVTFVPSGGGMLVTLLLFFAINPALVICIGTFSGRNRKAAWFQPSIPAALFLLGAWHFLEPGEPAFLLYAAAYLALGYAAMAISHFLMKK